MVVHFSCPQGQFSCDHSHPHSWPPRGGIPLNYGLTDLASPSRPHHQRPGTNYNYCGKHRYWGADCGLKKLDESILQMYLQAANWHCSKTQVNMVEEDEPNENYDDSESSKDLPEFNCKVVEVNLTVEGKGGSDWYVDAMLWVARLPYKINFVPYNGHSTIITTSEANLTILGRGNVATKKNKEITNVLYVSGLKHNLMSVGKLTDAGNVVVFTSDEYLVIDKNNLHLMILRASRDWSNNLYWLTMISDSITKA